ncbi:Formin-like protein 2 [Dufourea novaeangliae]|uniref:Formin-like protein 2 n=1 Tax=Dufourea novaeangliae TaxID=178035 RepID=A0A154PPQ6_DUFNO|nr:Formin-like protein 2 [Dufourea novaeangliae]
MPSERSLRTENSAKVEPNNDKSQWRPPPDDPQGPATRRLVLLNVKPRSRGESDMAPNAEEELLVVKPWGLQPEKERLRPPTYNAEDYAFALRRWGRRPLGSIQDSQGTLPSTTSSSSGYASGSGEMTLRQFTSVSELLNKLRSDLRLAFPRDSLPKGGVKQKKNFGKGAEFSSPPADGITLLLETLRGVQLAQSSPPSSGHTGPRVGTRRAALDELGCVECLAACAERCTDAPRLLVQAQPGLLALAVCLTSSLNRSRVLALQLLTKVCQTPGGHEAVSEAVSTLRLKYGEGGRFRFLAGALLAPRAAIALRVAGVSFLNAFLKSAPRTQTRLYIQAEACEAGLEPQVLQEWLKELDGREEDALNDLLHKEVQKWTHNCVDVDVLQRRVVRAEETCRILSKKVSALQAELQQLQVEKLNTYNRDDREKVTVLGAKQSPKVSSNAEDEGISSSERSSSPENTKHQLRGNHQKHSSSPDNDQETTIEDVIEELRIIVKDAEEEFVDKSHEEKRVDRVTDQDSPKIKVYKNSDSYLFDRVLKRDQQSDAKIPQSNAGSNVSQSVIKGEQVTYFGNDRDYSTDSSSARRRLNTDTRRISKSSVEGSVKIVIKGPDVEDAIVPTILYPQPPRRSPPCLSAIMAVRHCDFPDHEETYNSHDEEIEEETLGDGSDSLLSASRLKYNGKNPTYEEQIGNADADHFQQQSRNEADNENDGKFKKSFDDLRHFSESEVKDKKTARNYESSCRLKGVTANESKSCNRQTDGFVQRHNSKYRSEVEKRKLLRRSTSHDYLESSASSPRSRRSGRSRVESHIRKFESLNSFDEHRSLQSYGRPGSSENLSKQEHQFFDENSRTRMRRSESFHHISHVAKKEQCSSRGGSDSGLFYVTDFNLEPFVTRRPRSIEAPKSPSLLTKSLDRIDEGLDSMVDIVITEEKSQWSSSKYQTKTNKSREDRQLVRSKSSRVEDSNSCYELETNGRKEESRNKHLKNDEFYAINVNNKQLRSDELYDEQRNREWNCQNELNSARKNGEFDFDCTPVILMKNGVRHNSFSQHENIGSKFSNRSKDSGIFAGRTYDTFGLGKHRFNAGKYSGNQQIKDSPIGRRNTTSSAIGNHGKVTDVVSGLY